MGAMRLNRRALLVMVALLSLLFLSSCIVRSHPRHGHHNHGVKKGHHKHHKHGR